MKIDISAVYRLNVKTACHNKLVCGGRSGTLLLALFHCMVRYGSARLGTVQYGSVRVGLHFHRSLVPL